LYQPGKAKTETQPDEINALSLLKDTNARRSPTTYQKSKLS